MHKVCPRSTLAQCSGERFVYLNKVALWCVHFPIRQIGGDGTIEILFDDVIEAAQRRDPTIADEILIGLTMPRGTPATNLTRFTNSGMPKPLIFIAATMF